MLGRFLTPIAVVVSLLVAAPPSASAVDRTAVLVTTTATNSPFSPNHDGVKDLGIVRYQLTKRAYVAVRVSRHGTTVLLRTLGRLGAGTHSFVWNGVSNGRVVADATYAVSVVARRTRHGKPHVSTRALTVDARTTPEDGTVRMSSATVYPRTTVIHDVVVGNLFAGRDLDFGRNAADYETVRLQVLDQRGRVIDSGAVQGTGAGDLEYHALSCRDRQTCGRFTWDGRDSHGNVAPDGSYRIRLVRGRDRAGNLRLAAPLVRVRVSSTPLVAVTASTSLRAADIPRHGPYYDDSCLGCSEYFHAGAPSARFDHGVSYDSRCTPPPFYADHCPVSDTYWLPFTGRRTPMDRFTISAHGGPTPPGGSDVGHFSAGGGTPVSSVAMQGDATATLSDLPFADNTEVPVPGRVPGLRWSFRVPADGTAYDVASFDVTWTTYAPAS